MAPVRRGFVSPESDAHTLRCRVRAGYGTVRAKMSDQKSGANPLFLREEELRQGIELLFYGWRDFTADLDQPLERAGLGRAHHRAIYFIGRNPGTNVGALLGILKITKQSLSRVLQTLIQAGLVEQKPGTRDRRQRHLNLTATGAALERELSETQRQRLARAYRMAGAESVEGFRQVLLGLIDERDRARLVASRPSLPATPGRAPSRPGGR